MANAQNRWCANGERPLIAALAAGAAAGFLLASAGNARLVRLRAEHRLDAADPLLNAPPVVAFTTVVLGGFRGLIADALWLRAARMQEQGRFFELVQLADWITKLEPRCTEIWAFHAWNMAYNVSIMMSDDGERWRWVHNGIGLLARDGLRYNPGDPSLYFEIGWLFQHKIGGVTDRRHGYYKHRWAAEMTALLGGGRPDFDALSTDSERQATMLKEYGLSPETMREVDEKYGPLDWRTAEAHAVYWAYRGLRAAPDGRFLPSQRMIYQSLTVSLARGRLIRDEVSGALAVAPHPEILPRVLEAYESALRDYPIDSVKQAYAGFLRHAVLFFEGLEREAEARGLFERLRRMFPDGATAAGYEASVRQWKEALR